MAEQAQYHELPKTNYLSGRADYLSVNFPLLVADCCILNAEMGHGIPSTSFGPILRDLPLLARSPLPQRIL
jgi:hypothetical protein